MTIIDTHHHLWDLSKGYAWLDEVPAIRRTFTMADLAPILAETGVTRTILVEGGRCQESEVDEFLTLAAQHDQIAGVVGWCDIEDPRLPDDGDPESTASPEQNYNRYLVGARSQIQGESDPEYLYRPTVLAGLRTLARRGIAFDLVVRVDQLKACAAAAAATPELTFVLDHLGKPSIRDGARGLAEWRAAIEPLAKQPNVFAKLSGLVTEADHDSWRAADLKPFVDTALDLFGPDRLMFGSDWPVCLLASTYQRWLDTLRELLDPSLHQAVFTETATRAYKLPRT
ncbi:amidohydrolase family protein [Allorhizocola rhizosphaerae]|uniref:amidohydrolase family protein n=1 Tax=Allorhizocola rhizosphaerae TaxID=1872709 RepID=UPI000E3C574C|nr:amidohydrolase family protein [Allorhizocola rhizosphaerae]